MTNCAPVTFRRAIGLTLILGCGLVFAQQPDNANLAGRLANEATREAAIAEVAASPSTGIPLLLSWAHFPPPDVDPWGLMAGLAETFGRLKVAAAIPYLIENLSTTRDGLNHLGESEYEFPAAGALIQIGPRACRKLMDAANGPMVAGDRTLAVFAISRMVAQDRCDREAIPFLVSAVHQADKVRYWADRAIQNLPAFTPAAKPIPTPCPAAAPLP